MIGKLFTLLWTSRKRARLVWSLLQDKRIPTWQKAIPFLPLIYIFSPLNFITFAIPFFGQLDDVALIFLAMDLFENMVEKSIVEEHKLGNQVE